jgi:hypothetical protein
MNVFILKAISPDRDYDDCVSISIHSTRELALKAFEQQWEAWNDELGDGDEDQLVPVATLVEELALDYPVTVFGTDFTIEPYEIDSNQTI